MLINTNIPFRLLLSVVLSMLCIIVVYFIPLKLAAIIVLTSTSLLVSLDVCSLLLVTANKLINRKQDGGQRGGEGKSRSEKKWKLVGCVVFTLLMSNAATLLIDHFYTTTTTTTTATTTTTNPTTSWAFNCIGIVLLVVSLLHKLLCSVQQIFIVCNLVTNPLYQRVAKGLGRGRVVAVLSQFLRLAGMEYLYCLLVPKL